MYEFAFWSAVAMTTLFLLYLITFFAMKRSFDEYSCSDNRLKKVKTLREESILNACLVDSELTPKEKVTWEMEHEDHRAAVEPCGDAAPIL